MILSFHPCFEADKNILCAGRLPSASDIDAIKSADAVILPQGCTKELYKTACKNCLNVFPNYTARYTYMGKTGQIRLFNRYKAVHPFTEIFSDTEELSSKYPDFMTKEPFQLPFVFKFDWGGEGSAVFLIKSRQDYFNIINKARLFEKTGQTGFLFQQYIENQNKTLRVVVIEDEYISYWRIQKDSRKFYANLSKGAVIDHDFAPELQKKVVQSSRAFCAETGINLAGFDFLFSQEQQPLFLEINYFFGRKGLGGSNIYYELLKAGINRWLAKLQPF
mmetsp:Transcript_595/g.411  ORF Transcript_595/g.411 Transcript_595/m.411 type:complete len:277 (-) Transcript_595:242-1072(-)